MSLCVVRFGHAETGIQIEIFENLIYTASDGTYKCNQQKKSSSQYLADLQEIRKAYARSVKENYPIS